MTDRGLKMVAVMQSYPSPVDINARIVMRHFRSKNSNLHNSSELNRIADLGLGCNSRGSQVVVPFVDPNSDVETVERGT